MDGKGTILLTGANGGYGRAIVSHILSTPSLAAQHHGIYTVRNAATASALHRTLQSSPNSPSHTHDIMSMDLSRLSSVREAAASINARVAAGEIPPIRALILNAGFIDPFKQSWTDDTEEDGRRLDMTFVSNYLGHWLLTLLLLQSMDRERGRVVVVSSSVHDPEDKRNDVTGCYKDNKWRTFFSYDESGSGSGMTDPIAYGTWSNNSTDNDAAWRSAQRRYGASKLCLVMMVGELQRRLDADARLNKICVLAVDPGTMPGTELVRRSAWVVVLIFRFVLAPLAVLTTWLSPNGSLRTTRKSAADMMVLALKRGEPLCEYPKGWYMNGLERAEPSDESKDERKRECLWRDSVRYTRLAEGETCLGDWR
ncbi:putative short-chain dehydrogenase [Canariomyces notabilis]|uniref:Short-chain dehydrogenase n=1 Tax=Canariomyces notabilis TaxID=2074819 RepID=A0AAN6TF26_9PEZI|nr:putative short-chain dehydrogenase [Canariomyces arenarius]